MFNMESPGRELFETFLRLFLPRCAVLVVFSKAYRLFLNLFHLSTLTPTTSNKFGLPSQFIVG